MSIIEFIEAREILDSRGNPTVEVDVILEDGSMGRAAVPSGASTGVHEAVELRDGDKKRFMGKGVLKAVDNVNTLIAPELEGMDALDQVAIDTRHERTRWDREQIQAGSQRDLLGVSMASGPRSTDFLAFPSSNIWARINPASLPDPMANILNGGAHSDNKVDFQEFMVIARRAPSIREAIRMTAESVPQPQDSAQKARYNTSVGDEGGFAPDLQSNEEALEVIMEAIKNAVTPPARDGLHDRARTPPPPSYMMRKPRPTSSSGPPTRNSPAADVELWTSWVNKISYHLNRRRHGRG